MAEVLAMQPKVIDVIHDPVTDAAYVVLGSISQCLANVAVTKRLQIGNAVLNLDFNDSQQLVGIEAIPASLILPAAVLR